MRRIQLDYARREHKLTRLIGLIVLVASLGLASYLMFTYVELNQRLSDLESRRAQQDMPISNHSVTSIPKNTLAQVEQANQVISQLTVPWNELFETIESLPHEHVGVLSISPDVANESVTINAEAEAPTDIATYIDAINETDILEDAHIVNHQVKTQDPQKPVNFTVIAKWKIDGHEGAVREE